MTDDSRPSRAALDTLEPLVEAVREGVESTLWTLSGLQKTSSTEFEGRWAGESTRSAYLFFHRPGLETVSIEAYLDETSRGLRGNIGLVADVRPLWELESVPAALDTLSGVATRHVPESYQVPVTMRLRLPRAEEPIEEVELESRIKLRIPRGAFTAGAAAVSALASTAVGAFEAVLGDPEAAEILDLEGEEGLARPAPG
jgi:hypothetical protein